MASSGHGARTVESSLVLSDQVKWTTPARQDILPIDHTHPDTSHQLRTKTMLKQYQTYRVKSVITHDSHPADTPEWSLPPVGHVKLMIHPRTSYGSDSVVGSMHSVILTDAQYKYLLTEESMVTYKVMTTQDSDGYHVGRMVSPEDARTMEPMPEFTGDQHWVRLATCDSKAAAQTIVDALNPDDHPPATTRDDDHHNDPDFHRSANC